MVGRTLNTMVIRMQSVRCEACGLRALVAASTCPHCGHLFELRDSMGKLLPLAHCVTCDSFYPRARGECRWCGTKPEAFPVASYAWKGAGVLAFIGLAWGAWFAHRTTEDDALTSRTLASASVDSQLPIDSGLPSGTVLEADTLQTVAPADSGEILVSAGVADTPIEQTPTEVAPTDTAPVETVVPPARPAPIQPAPIQPRPIPAAAKVEADPPPVRAATKLAPRAARPSPKPSAPSRRRSRWVVAVARSWVPVRVAADHKSRIVASVGPDTRVQLGEARGSWVRLRTRGLTGWVERRSFVSRSE